MDHSKKNRSDSSFIRIAVVLIGILVAIIAVHELLLKLKLQ